MYICIYIYIYTYMCIYMYNAVINLTTMGNMPE